jgi:hypothetical protein
MHRATWRMEQTDKDRCAKTVVHAAVRTCVRVCACIQAPIADACTRTNTSMKLCALQRVWGVHAPTNERKRTIACDERVPPLSMQVVFRLVACCNAAHLLRWAESLQQSWQCVQVGDLGEEQHHRVDLGSLPPTRCR